MRNFLWQRLNSPRVIVAIIAIVYLLFIISRLAVFGFDPSRLVTAGDKFCDPNQVPANLSVLKKSLGYDGEFYYRLALNPFTAQETEFGIRLDFPAYRQQRIIYPLLVWALSFGQAQLVPWMMIGVNFLGLCLMAWFAARYAQELNQNALWGMLIPLYPGFLLTLSRNLTEIIAITFLLGSLLFIRKSRPILATGLIILAILTKESAVVIVAGAFILHLYELWKKKSARSFPGYYIWIPLVTYIFWQVVLWIHWGQLPILGGNRNLGLPFVGFITFFRETAQLLTIHQRIWFIELVYLIMFSLIAISSFRKSEVSLYEKVVWILYAGLVSLLTTSVWTEDWAFLRTLSEYYVLGIIGIIASQTKLKYPIFAGTIVVWLMLFWTRTNWRLAHFL
ncbi:MAG: hypothetical protein QME64_08075 [bacterium]|nr:hypothetical protein [bacterium]